MNIKIISDGTAWGTKVVNAETGEIIKNVVRATISLEPMTSPRVELEVIDVEIELIGTVEETTTRRVIEVPA